MKGQELEEVGWEFCEEALSALKTRERLAAAEPEVPEG
jgi:hypothetical protein